MHVVVTDLHEKLHARGLSATAQRLAVFRAVMASPHATADTVLSLVRADIGTVSRQSVYDALTLFVEQGMLRRIQPVGSPALYEGRVGANHHHVICRLCGHVADVDCAVGETPCLTAATDHGFVIDEAEVAYWGLCAQCQLERHAHVAAQP